VLSAHLATVLRIQVAESLDRIHYMIDTLPQRRGLRQVQSLPDNEARFYAQPFFPRLRMFWRRRGMALVGWMLAARESAELAEQLIADTIQKHNIVPGTLMLHADRGSSMRSKPVAALLIDLDVAKTHSRPHVSDDNPYSEAQFKTLKYRPDFPERFGSIEDARVHCQQFFRWYNTVHRHSGIALMTPEAVHYGTAVALTQRRAVTLDTAFAANPIRFKGLAPKPPELPTAAWINPPKKDSIPRQDIGQMKPYYRPNETPSVV
jgi:hypothetical protein